MSNSAAGAVVCLLKPILQAMPCRNSGTVFLPDTRSWHIFWILFKRSTNFCDTLLAGWVPTLSCCTIVVTVDCSRWNHLMAVQILGCEYPTSVWNLLFHPSQTLLVLGLPSIVALWTLQTEGWNIGGTRRIVSCGCWSGFCCRTGR